MSASIRLTATEEAFALELARLRDDVSRAGGARHKFMTTGSMDQNLQGARSEIAVARVFGVPLELLHGTLAERYVEDVPGVGDVRGTRWISGGLMVYPEDLHDRPTILVTGDEVLYLRGWLYNREAMLERYWRPDLKYPCYLVPQGSPEIRGIDTHPASAPRLFS